MIEISMIINVNSNDMITATINTVTTNNEDDNGSSDNGRYKNDDNNGNYSRKIDN